LLQCSRRMPSRTRAWRDSILQGGDSGPEFRKGLICHHHPKMIVSMKWTNPFCWLCPMGPFLLYILYGR
jgi:hypothetical protein